jgi:uncharacterized membrane protein
MNTSRLETFSDGVMAVIITIMVLGLKVPSGASIYDLKPLLPNFLIYALSFLMLGIYWNNHHQLLRATKKVTSGIMWSNLLLLFCLSLIPFFTNWFGQHHAATVPTAAYGTVLLAAAIGYWTLLQSILKSDKRGIIRKAVGNDLKGNISLLSYLVSIPLAFVRPWLSIILFVFVAIIWFIPDKRLESVIED